MKSIGKAVRKVANLTLTVGLAGGIIAGVLSDMLGGRWQAEQTLAQYVAEDSTYEPEFERELERKYGVNVFGNEFTEQSLEEAAYALSFVNPARIKDLNIVFSNGWGFRNTGNGSKKGRGVGGEYFQHLGRNYGPTIFIKPRLDANGILHEVFHHIHLTHERKEDFDVLWYGVPTKVTVGGKFVDVTTEEAIRRFDNSSFIRRKSSNLGSWPEAGPFGFVSPYGTGSIRTEQCKTGPITLGIKPSQRNNLEDVATFAQLVPYPDLDPCHLYTLAAGKEGFSLQPYKDKIELLVKFDFIRRDTANDAVELMEEHYGPYRWYYARNKIFIP